MILSFFYTKHFDIFVSYMKLIICILFLFLIPFFAFAQTDSTVKKTDSSGLKPLNSASDSVIVNDTLTVKADSSVLKDSIVKIRFDTLFMRKSGNQIIENEIKSGSIKLFPAKEGLFYYIIFLFLLIGLLRMGFSQYFNNLFRVIFRTSIKQKQIRDLLLQSPVPSVLMNCFFVLSSGLYIIFLLIHLKLLSTDNFWINYIYCMGALAFVYIIKFLGLKITGWLFNASEVSESYIFIVFIINKMLGIAFLPFIMLLAFTTGPVFNVTLNLSWITIALLFGYRFILSYNATRKEIKLNPFHFVLYICAFEIVPLLLIYKLLMIIFW